MSAAAADFTKAIVVFSSRESIAQLRRTVASCINTIHDVPATIDIVINGNVELAQGLCLYLESDIKAHSCTDTKTRVWHLGIPDKAHAWNAYIYHIWPNATHTLFVDGYCEIFPNCFDLLSNALFENPSATAAAGVATVGMTARKQTQFQSRIRGINGGLHCLTIEAMLGVREAGFRLPRGLYRTDATLESILKFSFDPSKNHFDSSKVVVETRATYWRRSLVPWNLNDLFTHFRRMLRQAQGDFEQQAVRQAFAFDKKRPNGLPDTARELVLEWIERFPHRYRAMVLRNPLRWFAARRLRTPAEWKGITDPPTLLATFGEARSA